jgi:hypothetical protein
MWGVRLGEIEPTVQSDTRKVQLMLKDTILEAIAAAYCTTVSEVLADISAMPIAEQQLTQFCESMEEAGY